jgi:hypothetical protein
MKIIPNEFYVPYFELIDPQVIDNAELFRENCLNWKYLDLTILKKKSSTSLMIYDFLYLQNLSVRNI